MSSGVGGSRVSIPNNVRKTIQNIREITGKLHADDEIYAVLRECSMDPNETAQKLLYLDTFHEVKRRRDRRKENLNSKASEERSTPGVQRRAARGGGQGNYGSNFSSDAGGGKNAARRDNGVNHTADRGPMSFSQRTKNYAAPRVTKASTCLPNGTANLSNGTSRHGHATKSSVDSEDPCLCDVNKSRPASAQPAALGVTSSSTFVSTETEEQQSDQHFLNPVAGVLSLDSLSTPSVSASMVEDDAGRQQLVAEADHITENKAVSDDNISSGQSEGDKAMNGALSQNTSSKPGPSAASQSPSLSAPEGVTSEVAVIAAEVSSQSTSESHVSSGQHVTFPNHFQVPEALKNGLTFGSFDATFGPKVESVGSGVDDNAGAPESSEDSGDASKVPSPSDQNASSTGQGDSLDDNSQSVAHVLEKLQPSEGSTESKVEQSNQDTQYPPEGPQNPPVINGTGTGYGFGIMPPLVGSQFAQVESREAQAHESIVPNLANGNSLAPPSTNASPPLPNSIAVSPQTVPVVRHTYPPNFFPYGQYLSPFYIPPMHQFLSHNGFPAQPSTGNVYLPPAPTGVKFSLPQFKPGNTAGNPTHVGIQPAGSFITAPVGYAQPVTSGSSMGNEDLVASHLKENPIYTTGQLTEGSAVWIHPGQDMPSLQVNSLYNLLPRGHITFSPQQSGHGTFGGMFPPGHAMTAPSTLLQQSQAMAGAIETIGPPSAAYQQPQHGQMNWNTAAF